MQPVTNTGHIPSKNVKIVPDIRSSYELPYFKYDSDYKFVDDKALIKFRGEWTRIKREKQKDGSAHHYVKNFEVQETNGLTTFHKIDLLYRAREECSLI